MTLTFNLAATRNEEGIEMMSREERKALRKTMMTQFVEMLHYADVHLVEWTASKCDLAEVLHEVYMAGLITTLDGTPCKYISLAQQAFGLLHTGMPANLYSLTSQARGRNNKRQPTFFVRYCTMMRRQPDSNPFMEHMIKPLDHVPADRQLLLDFDQSWQ